MNFSVLIKSYKVHTVNLNYGCVLNTGLGKVGTIVHGAVTQTSVPLNTDSVIGEIMLPAGKWIIIASLWLHNELMVSLSIYGITNVMGLFRKPQVVGLVAPSTQTMYKITCTQWTQDSITVVAPDIAAIRIA